MREVLIIVKPRAGKLGHYKCRIPFHGFVLIMLYGWIPEASVVEPKPDYQRLIKERAAGHHFLLSTSPVNDWQRQYCMAGRVKERLDMALCSSEYMDLFSMTMVNKEKSQAFFSRNVCNAAEAEITRILGFPRIENLGCYLGVPLLHYCLNHATYVTVVDKTSTLLFAMCIKVETTSHNFLWGHSTSVRKVHLLFWDWWSKLNIDGSVSGIGASIGGLIKDAHGRWVGGFHHSLGKCHDIRAKL
ncbi:hypothetical protein Ancab_029173 [Ancistrocladus abbreviatus]